MAEWDARHKTILVTGGASGLGAEYAQVFLNDGAKFKQIDVIVNNAGIMNDATLMWRTACDVNWQGLVSLTMKGVKHMRKDEGGAGGTIVNISSKAALIPFQPLPIYSGSKLAVLHFSQTLAMDPFYKNTGIRILTFCFGATETPLIHNLELKTYDPHLGKMLASSIEKKEIPTQKVEFTVRAFVDMFKNGAPGTVWLSVVDKPVQDITPLINRIFEVSEKL